MAPSYSVGRAYVEVVPSFRDFQKKIGREAKGSGETFQQVFEQAVRGTTATVDADTSGAQAEVRTFAATVNGTTASVRVDADTGDSLPKVAAVESVVQSLDGKTAQVNAVADVGAAQAGLAQTAGWADVVGSKSPNVQVTADTAAAAAGLSKTTMVAETLDGKRVEITADADTAGAVGPLQLLRGVVARLDGKRVNVKADADTASARAQLNSLARSALGPYQGISAIAVAAGLLGPAIVPGVAAATGALVGLTGAAVASGAAVGVLALAFSPVIGAVEALAKAEDSAADDAQAAADKREQAAKQVQAAQERVGDAERAVGQARDEQARAAQDAAQRVEDADRGVQEAVAAKGKAVADAEAAAGRARDEAARAAQAADARVADAARGVREAEESARAGVESALSALGDAREAAARGAEDAADRVAAAARAVRDAEQARDRAVGDAQRSLVRARAEAAASVEAAREKAEEAARAVGTAEADAAAAVDAAQAKAKEARRDAAESAREQAEKVQDALRDQRDVQRDVAADIADAQAGVADAVADRAQAMADAQDDITDAVRDSQDAYADLQDTARDLGESYRDLTTDIADMKRELGGGRLDVRGAELDLAEARQRLGEARSDPEATWIDREQAALRMEKAERRLNDQRREQAELQDEINQSQKDADALRSEAAKYGGLDVAGGGPSADVLDQIARLHDAEKKYAASRRKIGEAQAAREATWAAETAKVNAARVERRRVELEGQGRIAEAARAVADARREQAAAAVEQDRKVAAADAAVVDAQVEGRAKVSAAERAAQDAREAVDEARVAGRQRVGDAERSLERARVDGAARVADAERALEDAREAQEQQRVDGAKRVQAARDAVDQARVDGQKRVDAAGRALADAEQARDQQRVDSAQRVRDADAAVVDARVEGNARIAEAERALSDAVEAQRQQQVDSARRVEDAQRGLARAQEALRDAMADTAVEASTAQKEVARAFENLTPVGAKFARQVFGMRRGMQQLSETAQNAMLPGVSRALTLMGANFPGLNRAVDLLGTKMGDLSVRAARALTGPWWQQFGTWISKEMPGWLDLFATSAGNTFTALAGMFQGMGPLVDWFLQGLERATARWAEWAQDLEGSNGARRFMDYVRTAGPLVWEWLTKLGTGIVHLGIALAPLGDQVLRVTGRMLDWFNSLDPAVIRRVWHAVSLLTGGLMGAAVAYRVVMTATGALKVAWLALRAGGGLLLGVFKGVSAVAGGVGKALKWLAGKAGVLWGALRANPLGAIRAAFSRLGTFLLRFNPWTAVAAVAAAFFGTMYSEHEGFRALVNTVFRQVKNIVFGVGRWLAGDGKAMFQGGLRAIGRIFGWVKEHLIAPAMRLWRRAAWLFAEWIVKDFNPKLQRFLDSAGRFFTRMYERYIRPAWRNITAAAREFARWFGEEGWPAIKRVAKAIGDYWKWLYEKVAKPVFGFIGDVVWEFAKFFGGATWDAIRKTVKGLAELFGWYLDNIMVPYWRLITEAVKKFWVWFRDKGWPGIKRIAENLAEKFRKTKNNISEAWSGIREAARSAKEFLGRQMDRIKSAADRMADGFKAAWDRVQRAAKSPVKFLVDTVYNNGIRKMVNKIADTFGLDKKLPSLSWSGGSRISRSTGSARQAAGRGIPRATGGPIPGWSPHDRADNIPVMATAGEYMLSVPGVRKLTAQIGAKGLDMLNKGILPGAQYLAGGGRVSPLDLRALGRDLQRMGLSVYENNYFGGVTPGAHKTGKYGYHYKYNGTGAIDVDATRNGRQDNNLLNKAVRLALGRGFGAIWQAPGHYNHAHFDVGGFRRIGTTAKAGGLAAGWDRFASAARGAVAAGGAFVGKQLDGAKDLFGSGWDKITDFTAAVKNKLGGGFSDALGGYNFRGLFPDLLKRSMTKVVDLLKDKLGSLVSDFNVGSTPGEQEDYINRARKYADGGVIQGPYTRDSGGYIPTGTSLVHNYTGAPELILNQRQEAELRNGGGDVHHHYNYQVHNPAAERPSRTMQKTARYAVALAR